ncbi:MAG: MFS transporter [Kiloniellales bacterium]|nr:MFS transporter [Kiloniellales bacterium]
MTEAENAAASRPADAGRSWREAFAVYAHRRVVAMAFLGFSAGLPFLLIFSTLSFWLREAGIERSTIGFFSWVGITFSIKVLWAPVVDRAAIPLLTRALGKRRSWILLAQVGIALALLGIAATDPAGNTETVALLALCVAFCSATQDIGIDAYRIEAVEEDLQGAMAATYQLGYRLALLAAGAGALYVADFFSWPAAYVTMAALMLVGIATILVVGEPKVVRDEATRQREAELKQAFHQRIAASGRSRRLLDWFAVAVIGPLVDFFRRNGRIAIVILALVGFYRLSDITMGIMANPFYVDIGFTKSEVASISKVFGLFMTILGAFLGGLLVARFGILRPLLLGALLVATTNLLFAWLAAHGEPDVAFLTVTISADNLSAGLAGSSFIAYLSSLTNRAYTATQYALFSSLFTLPGKVVGGFSGVVVDAVGYVDFFIYASVLGLPAILLVVYFLRREGKELRSARGVA